MEHYKLDATVFGWVTIFLLNRTFTVSLGVEQSSVGRVTNGVPQGLISGNLLFLININELDLLLSVSNRKKHIMGPPRFLPENYMPLEKEKMEQMRDRLTTVKVDFAV